MSSSVRPHHPRLWKVLTTVFVLISVGLLIALILAHQRDDSGVRTCGGSSGGHRRSKSGTGKGDDVIDLSEPMSPGPFHDLTEKELLALRSFLERDKNIKASAKEFAPLDSSAIFMADLFLPPKSEALQYLDHKGPQPPRRARVMMFRGDLKTPKVEEYLCGPLPEVTSCRLMTLEGRRNPVDFSVRPFNLIEWYNLEKVMLKRIDKDLGYILLESYGTTFTECESRGLCLGTHPSPVGTAMDRDITLRRMWISATYQVEHRSLNRLDFGALLNLSDKDPSKWTIDALWYAGRLYQTMDDLIQGYNASSIPVTKIKMPSTGPDLFTRMTLKGDPWPNPRKRPPQLVEPDGKRYTIKHRKVEYMDWTFNFRLSPFSGAALNDVRFKGERIVYDMGLQELAVFYSAFSPLTQTADYIDSAALLGSNSRALVAGADCPDTAVFIDQKFMAQYGAKVAHYKRALCVFENNAGYPLRRHLTHHKGLGAVYTGMLDSALTLRTAMTIGNYDYILDFIFHQNGVLETRWMSSGYILSEYYTDKEKDYSFRMHGFRGGPLHHHMAHFKVDLDVSGTDNRYETLDIRAKDVQLTMDPSLKIQTTDFSRNLKETELDAVYKYNFDTPKIHLVHNQKVPNQNGQIKAYRIDIQGMSKQLRYKRMNSEVGVSWARNQLTMTRQRDREWWSSSSYAMWDSANPTVDFSRFYTDNDNITDQDLVAWISLGVHHIPRTEDLPVTSTLGNHRGFLLMPFNYFPHCPSMRSTDAIRLTHADTSKPEKGIKIERHGNPDDQCKIDKPTLEEELKEDPDSVLETNSFVPVF